MGALLVNQTVQAQSILPETTLTLKPGAEEGEDGIVMTTYGCWPSGYPGLPEGLAGGNGTEIQIADWTFGNCGRGTIRSVIRFRALDAIPDSAVILSASLKLFGIPYGLNPPGNSTYPTSPYPLTNEGWVRRITSPWSESSISWNTQPTATTVNQVAMPVTNMQWNQDLMVDVTSLVNDIRTSGANEGFQLSLQQEQYYRSRYYATSDYPDSTKWPELILQYTLPSQLGVSTVSPSLLTINGVAPNPTTASWTANVTAASNTRADWALYDLTGRLLQRQSVTLQSGSNAIAVDAQKLPAGTYLLRVTAGESSTLQTAVIKY